MVQKTIVVTLHKEGKSQRVITERGVCSTSAVSKHIKCKVDWKEEIGKEKVHKQQGWPQVWEYCQEKLIQTLGRASQGVNWSWSQWIKSHHAQTSSGKSLPSHFWNRNNVRSILPWLSRKRKSRSGVSWFHLEMYVWRKTGEAQNPSYLKSSVKFLKSVTSAGTLLLFCFANPFFEWS